LTHLWNIPDDVPDVAEEVTISTEVDPRTLEMEKLVFKHGNVPPLTIENDLVQFIEFSTRGQRLCPVWLDLHRGRITSSIFGQVLRAGSSPNSLINNTIEGSSLHKYSSLPPAVKWGQDHENEAKQQYIALKSVFGDVVVEETGLTLCASHSFLGASSDGKVCDAGEEGVLEIKCPFSLKGKPVNKMEIQEIVNLSDPAFCLVQGNDGPKLSRHDHDYYAQVQGEMEFDKS
ncbi:uncharacterized protein LOC134264039, partial [Saccostrea cucullata]|uniref:uncharacterized protein LOC134264039 n=1 Tax=Saccostrea cuccullata TaxID=36930 RepID=UPI002ED1F7EE